MTKVHILAPRRTSRRFIYLHWTAKFDVLAVGGGSGVGAAAAAGHDFARHPQHYYFQEMWVEETPKRQLRKKKDKETESGRER